ncbi:MAG: N-acetylmuramoyl-L-alanine amidase [Propionibacteriaceae bacterium]
MRLSLAGAGLAFALGGMAAACGSPTADSSPTSSATPTGPTVASASAASASAASASAATPTAVTRSPSPTAGTGPTRTPGSSPSPSATTRTELSPSPLIVIDPGHSGSTTRSRAINGLRDIDYPNYPEIYEMFDVSVCVARALRADGYRVRLTKDTALGSVSHTDRAAVANDHRAALAISVHDDHGVGPSFQHTYDQRGTQRRDGSYPQLYRGTGSRRTVFDDPAVAKRSQRYARIIAAARTKAQERRTTVTQNSFDGRAPLEPGNLALVQLFSEVPWVYNEMGALTDGNPTRAMSIASETGYAEGLLAGVEAAVPLVAGQEKPRTDSAAALRPCLVKQVEPRDGELTRPRRYLPDGFR